MKTRDPYTEGHVFVAAVRICEHRDDTPPSLQQIAELAGFAKDQASLLSRRLEEKGIIRTVDSAFGIRWAVADHLALEDLPRSNQPSQLDQALQTFQKEKGKMAQKIESIQAQQARKKKDLFADIEKKLKKDLPGE